MKQLEKRISDRTVLKLIRMWLKCPVVEEEKGGKRKITKPRSGTPQGGVISPLLANIYLNEVDWCFDAIRIKTAQGSYEAVNYHRFSDDIVITVSGHHTKRGWAERALLRLREQLAPLGVELNAEKTRMVDTLKGEVSSSGALLEKMRAGKAGSQTSSPFLALRITAARRERDISNSNGVPVVRSSGLV